MTELYRIPVVRVLKDGTRQRGSGRLLRTNGGMVVDDFRDAMGEPWELPGGATFEFEAPLTDVAGGLATIRGEPMGGPLWRLHHWLRTFIR